MSLSKETIVSGFQALQDSICAALEQADGQAHFVEDAWTRAEGGGGRTRIMQNGKVIEKGGVNFSAVHGPLPDNIRQALGLDSGEFFATGVSIVMHPVSPMVPIIHMNVRYFEMSDGSYWFGGGIDLTPHYIQPTDAQFFHNSLKAVCDKYDAAYYPKFKQWADDYFYIKHRKETRGVGGIFFDRLKADADHSKEDLWAFVRSVGESFAPTYVQLIRNNVALPFTLKERQWQLVRRGRYVEFNLVYDKGTKFGLDTDGRIESILMSLPPEVNWVYNHQPESGSEEERTQQALRKGIDWVTDASL